MENPSVHASMQESSFCAHCGVRVKPGSCYSSMGTDPVYLCSDCYAQANRDWQAMKDSMDARKTFIVDTLCEGPASRRYICHMVPKVREAFRSLEKDGYSFSIDESGRYVMTDSPELYSFARSLSTCYDSGDAEWIRRTYSDHWSWLSAAYSDVVGQPRTDDPSVLMSYSSQVNSVPERFERLREDEALRRRVRMGLREQVFLKLLDLVFAECEGVTTLGSGKAEFKGMVKTYGPIVDESMIGDNSGFDCDILVSEDSVYCFADEDIVPFVDYFEQGSNEKVVAMLDYMCDLRRRGLRWYPSYSRWTKVPSRHSSPPASRPCIPGSPTTSSRARTKPLSAAETA